MITLEMVLCCLLIPVVIVLIYIAGKYNIIKMICDMLEENVKCEHEWHVEKKSNILQVDSMGYPLRLYIHKCSKCGASDQRWLDVPVEELEELKTGESFLLTWRILQ